jgi:type II secretory pathway component PulC
MTQSTISSPWANRLDTLAARAVGALPAIVTLGLLLVLAWRLAVWFWVLVPAPASTAAPVKVVEGGSAAVSRHWFGEAVLATTGPAATGNVAPPAASTAPEFRLLGVISGGRKSAAMIAVGKTTHDVLVGETFADGVRLQAVAADHVMLEKQGRAIRVDLPVATPAGPTSGLAPVTAPTAYPQSAEPGVPVHNPMRRPETAARKP